MLCFQLGERVEFNLLGLKLQHCRTGNMATQFCDEKYMHEGNVHALFLVLYPGQLATHQVPPLWSSYGLHPEPVRASG